MALRCPRCASEVQEGMRFCGVCGDALASTCPECGATAPPGQRFCGACGTPLEAAAPTVRERRLVSVLFCDVVGFTTFSESRDFEDVRDVLDEYFAAARRIVGGYGGTIEKFIGDAVMAVWGAPLAREDDAERSVRAGLELAAAVTALGARLGIAELRVRVGVLTGEAAVEVRSSHEGMVTGDAVNTAARIQSIADPGTVLVDDTTRLACERAIVFDPGGSHAVKGKSRPVRVWRAVRIREDYEMPSRFGTVEPPLVGRDVELEELRSALAGVIGGRASFRLMTVVGDAGTGKSRLSWEIERRVDHRGPIRWRRGRSVAFGEGSGLSALAEIVRMELGIARGDPVERRRGVVDQVIHERFGDDLLEAARVTRAIYRLLDLDDGRERIEQGELFSAWRSLFERLATEGPLVLVFEELQLADQALLDFIAHFREWSSAPVLILGLSRRDPRLARISGAGAEIVLEPLSEGEMDHLVAGAVDGAPESLLAAIRADGGGIPLYAVETLRALADRGVLAVQDCRYVVRDEIGELSVPPTISALVSSRLDTLDRAQQRVLTAGAVLGDSFSAQGAAAIAGVGEAEARTLLDRLVGNSLLALDSDPHAPAQDHYAFLQGVTRRVALARLSRRERKRAHLAAVEHLSPHGESAAAMLAGHLLAALEADAGGDDADSIRQRARDMLRTAAERAAAVGSPSEALSRFDLAAELTDDEREQATILERAGSVAYGAGDAEASAARFSRARELHAAAGRDRQRLRARVHELRALCYSHPPNELLGLLREVYTALGPQRDDIKALAATVLAFALYQCGEHTEALALASEAADIAETCGMQGELMHALGVQGAALQELERPQEAIAAHSRATALAAQHERSRVAVSAGNLAVSLCSVSRYREAVERAGEAIAAAQQSGERFFERWARLILGRALCSLGEWDRAVEEVESVKNDIPAFYVGMAVAPLTVIALARAEHERVQMLVAEHAARCGCNPENPSESDFRLLRAAALIDDGPELDMRLVDLIRAARTADFAEWPGWLSPIIDRLVLTPEVKPLEATLAALAAPGAMRRTPSVLVQAQRLAAHLAALAGEHDKASENWSSAERLARDCGTPFEHAVLALERSEHAARTFRQPDVEAVASAGATFTRLRATPWLARSERLGAASLGVPAGGTGSSGIG